MPLDWESIHQEWLLGGSAAISPEDVVGAFEIVERLLGMEWVEGHRSTPIGEIAGIGPTLAVATMGRALLTVNKCPTIRLLVERLKHRENAAFAELHRRAAIEAGHEPPALSINSHGFVAETSQQAVDEAFPPFAKNTKPVAPKRDSAKAEAWRIISSVPFYRLVA